MLCRNLLVQCFNLSQGKVSQWLKVLLPLLHKSLKKAGCMPATTAEGLYQRLIKVAEEEKIILHDAVERPITRQTDKDNQEDDYSGKQIGSNPIATASKDGERFQQRDVQKEHGFDEEGTNGEPAKKDKHRPFIPPSEGLDDE